MASPTVARRHRAACLHGTETAVGGRCFAGPSNYFWEVLMNTDHLIVELAGRPHLPGEAELAAVAFLARYNGRTLEAYQHDLRDYFGWAESNGLTVLSASRADIELYRHHMEQRALAASTIDRRLSTVCGYYRYAHIDGRIPTNPAQYVRRPSVHPSIGRGLDRAEFATVLFTAERTSRPHAALCVLLGLNGLRVSEACGRTSRTSASSGGTAPCG